MESDKIKETNFLLLTLLAIGLAVASASIASQLSSDGTVEIQEPANTSEEQVDVVFEDTGTDSRTADFHGLTVNQGDTVSDQFTLINNHDEELRLVFTGCQNFDRTYFVGPDEDNLQELDGNEAYPPVNDDVVVRAEIEVPEDAATGDADMCVDITAEPV